MEALARIIRQKREIKDKQISNEEVKFMQMSLYYV